MEKKVENQHINNLRVSKTLKRKKYKVTKKGVGVKLVLGALIIISLITIPRVEAKITEYTNLQAKTAIVQQYGEESPERNIADYIMISERLHNLKLGNFEISDELMAECNMDAVLLSPSEITALIADYEKQNKYIPFKSLDEEYNRIVLTAKLIHQERLVNEYIYEEGYDYAHKDITTAAKNYVGEVFGVDPTSIVFEYNSPKDESGASVNIKVVDKYGSAIYSYHVSGWGNNDIKDDIIDAVSYMDMTDKKFDEDDNDNNLYNQTRNIRIMKALKLSSDLTSKVNNNNLYNEDLNEDLINKRK